MAIIYGDVVGTTQRPANWNETNPSEVENIGGKKPTIHKEMDGNHTDHDIIMGGKIVKGSGTPKDASDLVPKSYVDARYSVFAFDQKIPAESWAEYEAQGDAEKNLFDSGYIKRAKLSITGVTGHMIPYLAPDETADYAAAGISGRAQSTDGGVYLYAQTAPTGPITILTAEFRKVET